jgi:L-ascorbate metabolism protein UlaG (beta-lactamase superfamily)
MGDLHPCTVMVMTMEAGASQLEVTYVGHATSLIEIDNRLIITDPVLRDRFTLLRRHGPALEGTDREPTQVQIVLLSHMHYDHADPSSIRRLPFQATLIAPRGAGLYLPSRVPQPIIEMSPGESVRLGRLTIHATPAAHSGSRPLAGMTSHAMGFIVVGQSTCFYFAGDTDIFDEMEHIGREFALDLALLPVAGYSPRTPPGHLNPRSAARALGMLKPRVVIPIHWGALRPMGPLWRRLGYLQDPPFTFVGYANQMAPQTEVRVLLPGETTRIASLPR